VKPVCLLGQRHPTTPTEDGELRAEDGGKAGTA
jgi:hypothetical protein